MFGKLSAETIEKRRLASVAAMEARDREKFDRWYQEECDRLYWTQGRCCAGCDFWDSDCGLIGRCKAAAPVSGDQVMRSLGYTASTLRFAPGHPYTRAKEHCGSFVDEFDWGTLPSDYLAKIGATHDGKLRDKPTQPAPQEGE